MVEGEEMAASVSEGLVHVYPSLPMYHCLHHIMYIVYLLYNN